MQERTDNMAGSDNQKSCTKVRETPVEPIEEFHTDVNRKKLTLKIDFHIIPLLLLTYVLQFMDKLAVSNASVFGLQEDNHLKKNEYSWVSSIFYFGYLAGQFPTSRLVQVIPVGKFVGVTVLLWGVVLASTASCNSYAGLLIARFFLGLLESCVSPIFVLITSMWYTPLQQPLRTGIWFSGNDLGGIIGGFISYGIGHIEGSLAPWQYIFIIYGCITILWGGCLLLLLPDSPQNAWFLTRDEKYFLSQTIQRLSLKSPWKWYQFRECLLDLKTWILAAICVLNILPNGGIVSYGLIIIKGFGFTSVETTLLNVPAYAITMATIIITGYIASRFRNFRAWMIIFSVIPPIAGGSMLYKLNTLREGLQLFAYYLLNVQPSTFPHVLALISSNFQGSTKISTMSTLIFVVYCAANIGAPQLFKSNESPKYQTAYRSWILSFCLTVFLAMTLRYFLVWENKRKDKENKENKKEQKASEENDITDKEDLGLKYVY